MVTNKRVFERNFKNNNSILLFEFSGNEKKDNIDYKRINKLLDDCFNHLKSYKDLERNVSWIRTILKDFDEESLTVLTICDDSKIFVKYKNKELQVYEATLKEKTNEKNIFLVKYDCDKGINFSFLNEKAIEYLFVKKITDQVSKILEILYSLKDTPAIELNCDSKLLCEIYQLFYNENPDFCDDNINIKVQVMMFILAEFGLTLGSSGSTYSFTTLGKGRMPISSTLGNLVDNLTPLGVIETIEEPIKLSEESKLTIQIVGEILREHIKDTPNQTMTLINISKIMYASRSNLSSFNMDKVVEYSNCSKQEVESSAILIKKIDKKLSQKFL